MVWDVEKAEVVVREELVERMSEGVFGLVRMDEVVVRWEVMGRRRRAYIDGRSCWSWTARRAVSKQERRMRMVEESRRDGIYASTFLNYFQCSNVNHRSFKSVLINQQLGNQLYASQSTITYRSQEIIVRLKIHGTVEEVMFSPLRHSPDSLCDSAKRQSASHSSST